MQCQPAYLDPSEGTASDTAGQSASVVNVVSSYLYNFMKKTIISVYPAVAYAYTVGSPVLNDKCGYSGTVGSIIYLSELKQILVTAVQLSEYYSKQFV